MTQQLGTEGYTLGPGNGESAKIAVCKHDLPLGWACYPCGEERGKGATVPAGPKAKDLYRAICDHCGTRVWLDLTPRVAREGG